MTFDSACRTLAVRRGVYMYVCSGSGSCAALEGEYV